MSFNSGTGAQTFSQPRYLFGRNSQLFVADVSNHRILVYDSWPTVNGQPADRVLGQSTFTNGFENDGDQNGSPDPTPTARTLFAPSGGFPFEDRLIVNDGGNNRLLIYESQ